MHARLKGKLTEKGITNNQVAELIECNVATVSLKMNGKTIITCDELAKIAITFKFSDEELLYILLGPRLG